MREEDNGSPWLSPPQALEEEGKKKKIYLETIDNS